MAILRDIFFLKLRLVFWGSLGMRKCLKDAEFVDDSWLLQLVHLSHSFTVFGHSLWYFPFGSTSGMLYCPMNHKLLNPIHFYPITFDSYARSATSKKIKSHPTKSHYEFVSIFFGFHWVSLFAPPFSVVPNRFPMFSLRKETEASPHLVRGFAAASMGVTKVAPETDFDRAWL